MQGSLQHTVDESRLEGVLEQPLFRAATAVAGRMGVKAFAIGGYVRDLLLARPSTDIDIVCEGNGIAYAEAVAAELGAGKVHVFKNFGTAMFTYRARNEQERPGEETLQVEFVGARKESYNRNSRKPEVAPGSLQDDQERRDFTINALAISLNAADRGRLVDPFQGMDDLRKGIIRTPLAPDVTFSDDPLRMLRAIRFATQLGFFIDAPTFEAIRRNAARLDIISAERIHTELNKIIMAPVPSIGFKMLLNTGLLERFFPEMVDLLGAEEKSGVGHKDNFYHTIQVLDNVAQSSNNLWLRWAAILHDIAKPRTKRFEPGHGWTFHGHEDKGARMVPGIFRRLKLPLDEQMRYVKKLVALHLRPIALTKEEVTDSAVRRLLFDAGDDVDDLMILCKADITSKNEARKKRYLTNYEVVMRKLKEVEEKDRVRNFQPPITGEDIMRAFNIPPCKAIGDIKTVIKDAILDGKIHNDKAAAWPLMVEEGRKLGLAVVPGMETAPAG